MWPCRNSPRCRLCPRCSAKGLGELRWVLLQVRSETKVKDAGPTILETGLLYYVDLLRYGIVQNHVRTFPGRGDWIHGLLRRDAFDMDFLVTIDRQSR